jgi:hypothetical protein
VFVALRSAYGVIATILLAHVLQLLAALYASTLPAGTKICRFAWALSNTQPPNVGGVAASTVTLVNSVQSKNTLLPILVTPLPMTTLVNPVQRSNAYAPMLVTLLGMITLVKPVQPLNALLPIVVTLLGMVVLLSPVQPENALLPIAVTLLGTMKLPVMPPGTRISLVITLL